MRHVIMSRPYRPLSGYGGFGGLPDANTYIPLKDPTHEPNDRGEAIFGVNRGWGATDGLAAGNQRVPNFESRYAKAQTISAAADAYAVGTPVSTLAAQANNKMADALGRVYQSYIWDKGCWFGTDPEGAVWDNCRSKAQVLRLKTALNDVNNALNLYDKLALVISKAPESWKSDYVSIDYTPQPATTTYTPPPTYKPATSTGGGALTAGGPTARKALWPKLIMFGLPALVLLGGGAYLFLKKPKARAVAGYGRHKSRRSRR